ncbi:MAG TPA: HepT-like ribonuclease domain-containing protein [Planctomycetota bacterium]|nr:HepT-like ribonuclease domain-containing protein [Planctomycetota bacterium]
MSPLEIAVLRRKLSRIVENLSALKALGALSVKEWQEDGVRRAAAERWLQVCIEAAIDLNSHLLVGLGHAAPADGHQSFLELARHAKVIDADLAMELAPSVGLRNRLLHRYDDLDDALVLKGMGDAMRLFPRYVDLLSRYVEQLAR